MIKAGCGDDQRGERRRLIFLEEMFAGYLVDVLDAGGAARDLTECAELEGRVRLPPDDLYRERAATQQAGVRVTLNAGQLEPSHDLQEGMP
jgi:hypothetical protein